MCFPDHWKVFPVVPVFKDVGENSTTKNSHRVSLLSVEKKSLRNGHILDLLITSRNVVFFLISSMVLCLLFQLKRFRKLQLTELLEFIIDLELLEL